MQDKVLLKIYEIVGGPVWVSTEDGQKVYEKIIAAFKAGRAAELSFANRDNLIPAFLNAAIGQLYNGEFTEQFLQDNLSFVDISPEDRERLDLTISNAKRYFANRSQYDAAWKQEVGDGDADHDKTGTAIGDDRMLHIATYWRNAANNYESAVLKAIACMGRNHVMELLREVNRLRRIVDALPKTADGVPIYPGMHVWFYAARSVSQSIDELKVVGWDWMPSLAPDAMHCINVVNEHGDEDGVNLACCYSTFDAADKARFAVKEVASRRVSDADASLDEAARSMFTDDQFAAWEAMGRKTCGTCGVPLRPCPKGPGADEPGYVSFYPCTHDDEDPNG